MASGTPKFPFLAEKTPPEGLWNPNFSFFGRKCLCWTRKWLKIAAGTSTEHVITIADPYDLSPEASFCAAKEAARANFGPDTLIWKVCC